MTELVILNIFLQLGDPPVGQLETVETETRNGKWKTEMVKT